MSNREVKTNEDKSAPRAASKYLNMENTFENNLKTLKELILDEGKIVTYISLSKDLCIHANEAKDLLNQVVRDIRKKEPRTEIYIYYMISGLLSNNSACTSVCSELDLDALRKSLNIIFYEHVYCVSKGMQAVDNVALTALNKFEDLSLCTGLIKANVCIKRSDNEILNLKSNNIQNKMIEPKSNVKTKNTNERKREFFKNTENVKKDVETKSESIKSIETVSPKKESSNNKISNKNSTKAASKSIAGFFNKANGDNAKAKTAKVKEDKEQENKVEIKVENEIKLEQPNADKNTSGQNETEEPVQKSKKMVEIEKPDNKSLKQIKKNAKVEKKRKRLLHVSDSESDNETNDPFADDDKIKMSVDQESEDEIPPTPTVNTVKITSGIINPKKRRKIVDKTYTDEDGYILTKKEEVYESCSDNEEEIKSKY
ncbi:unnamed protein product [Arctia plantaginis]|uniref:DNA polymerase delta subunit 3 n=1 Tax=Arctia plantaginis TaxID=874455 RepID=A0A8S0ZS20_ARCPL|nr:unnamed protein product [Arctia plantaginis]